ncbi:MAG: hypothetical protein LBP99_00135 [Azoarcus sp.]|nr:hypothetical protein [Azoarcus sp.]
MSLLRTAHLPSEPEPGSPSQSLLSSGIGVRFAIAAIACGLLWLAVFWALA